MWGPLFGNTVRMCCMQNCALHALPWPLFVSIFFNYLVDLCRLDSGVKKWDEKLETTVIIRGGGRRELCGGTGWENGFAGDREANMSGIAVERVYGVEWQVCIASFVCG